MGRRPLPHAARRTPPPISARPASSVTRPTPETAPRAKGLARMFSSTGRAAAKKFRSQNAGPWRDDQDQPGLQEVRGEQQTRGERNDQPPASTRASRSTRSADVAVVTGLGLQLEEDRQRARGVTALLHQRSEIVETAPGPRRRLAPAPRPRARAIRSAWASRRLLAINPAEQRRRFEPETRRASTRSSSDPIASSGMPISR